MKKIILASASPRRKEILSNIDADFEVIASKFDERDYIEKQIALRGNISPQMQTMMLAEGKAKDVFSRLDKNDNFVVIGVDTSVVVDNTILGKPKDNKEALYMLSLLSGRCHSVISGFSVIGNNGKIITNFEETSVWVRDVSKTEAENYVNSEYVLDKAGAYAIQGKASLFIEKIEGSYFNVVGLPIYKLAKALNQFDIYLV